MLLGVGENFIITGALSWGLALGGTQNTGKVMSWVGTSLYAAFAIGAPAGTALYAVNGFIAIALAATLIPLVTLLLVAPLRAVAPSLKARPSFGRVFSAVWLPGIGLAMFLDLSLGLTGPALELVASGAGLDSVFLASTLAVLCSLAIAARLLSAPTLDEAMSFAFRRVKNTGAARRQRPE